MSNSTMVFGSTVRRAEKWRVYRIGTANSVYELEVQSESAEGARRCAVLTRVQPSASGTFEDSAPRIGSESLYAVSQVEWIGKRLAVGTACTSEIVSVDFVKNASGPSRGQSMVFGAPVPKAPEPAPKQREPSPWAAYPQGEVEMLEAAASVLQNVCHRRELLRDLEGDALLLKRYKLALAACGVMLEALEKRG
ncbi:MAG: hypothetical protein JNK82_37515 [Myxococcaceae bacterium]|nr:hypothetical protein [Myxococcaceae bacterium]